MSDPIVITIDELLAELNAGRPVPEDFKTSGELAALWKCGCDRALKVLRLAAAEGRLQTQRVQRLTIAGHTAWLPGYKILPATATKKPPRKQTGR